MSPGELEAEAMKAAGNEDCSGKAGAEGLIDALGRAGTVLTERTPSGFGRRFAPLAVAAGLVLIAGIGLKLQQRTPKDTFTDPEKAYAQVEMVFSKIGDGMRKGCGAVDKSSEVMQKSIDIINSSIGR